MQIGIMKTNYEKTNCERCIVQEKGAGKHVAWCGLLLAMLLGLGGFSGAARAANYVVTWAGGAGNWTNTAKWTGLPPGVAYPNNGNPAADDRYVVRIDGGKDVSSSVTLDTSVTIGIPAAPQNNAAGQPNPFYLALQVDAGESLTIAPGIQLTMVGRQITNSGTINLNAGATVSSIVVGDPTFTDITVTLDGGGVVSMSNSANNRITGAATSTGLINVNNTISGAGKIGLNLLQLTNQAAGVIEASRSTPLVISPQGTATNAGTLRAKGAVLTLQGQPQTGGASFTNSGTVEVDGSVTAATLNVNSATITGGTLTTTGTSTVNMDDGQLNGGIAVTNSASGIIRVTRGPLNSLIGTLTNPAGGRFILDGGSTLTASGTYDNAGSIEVNGATILLSGGLTLQGGGMMTLSDSADNFVNGISGQTFSNVDNLISGAGRFSDFLMQINNQAAGIIEATGTNPLIIAPSSSNWSNAGTLRAVNGRMVVQGRADAAGNVTPSRLNNTGVIQAGDGASPATVTMDYVNIAGGGTTGSGPNGLGTGGLGGQINVLDQGVVKFRGTGDSSLISGALDGVVTVRSGGLFSVTSGFNNLSGDINTEAGGILDIGEGARLTMGAGSLLNNAGRITLSGAANSTTFTDLIFESAFPIQGGGSIELANPTRNRLYDTDGTITNQDNVIQGGGTLGDANSRIENFGTILVPAGMTMTIDPTNTNITSFPPATPDFVNYGTVLVQSGGTLQMGAGDIFLQDHQTDALGAVIPSVTRVDGTLQGDNNIEIIGGELQGTGTIDGNVVISNDNNAGNVDDGVPGVTAPGSPLGTLHVLGDYSQLDYLPGARVPTLLNIELGGTVEGVEYDQLDVEGELFAKATRIIYPNGNVNFPRSVVAESRGDLRVSLVNGFVPQPGDQFIIIRNDSAEPLIKKFAYLYDPTVQVPNTPTLPDVDLYRFREEGSLLADTGGQSLFSISYTGGDGNDVVLTALTHITFDDPSTPTVENAISFVEGNNGAHTVRIPVYLTAPSSRTVMVHYRALEDSSSLTGALALEDFQDTQGTLTFAPGETMKEIVVSLQGDTFNEDDETFIIVLNQPVNAALDTTVDAPLSIEEVVTIVNDDPVPTIIIDDPAPVLEGNSGTVTLSARVRLSAPSMKYIGVYYQTVDKTATVADNDYTPDFNVLLFFPGEVETEIPIQVQGDTKFEPTEVFYIDVFDPFDLLNPAGPPTAVIGDKRAICRILNDDAKPRISISDAVVNEGAGTADFTVTLSAASFQTVSLQYVTADNTATAPADYTAQALTPLVFNPGETTKTISVPIVDDTLDENNETFFVSLRSATNAAFADSRGTGRITDNDAPPALAISDSGLVTEGNSGTVDATFTVTLSAPSARTVKVDFSTQDNTATQPGDYAGTAGTLTFAPGAPLTQTIKVKVNGDTQVEPNETFFVTLKSPVNATLADSRGVGRIKNDDVSSLGGSRTPSQPSASVSPSATASVSAQSVTLTFTNSAVPASFAVTVNGQAATVQSVEADGAGVTLLLADGTLTAGDAVAVSWQNGNATATAE